MVIESGSTWTLGPSPAASGRSPARTALFEVYGGGDTPDRLARGPQPARREKRCRPARPTHRARNRRSRAVRVMTWRVLPAAQPGRRDVRRVPRPPAGSRRRAGDPFGTGDRCRRRASCRPSPCDRPMPNQRRCRRWRPFPPTHARGVSDKTRAPGEGKPSRR